MTNDVINQSRTVADQVLDSVSAAQDGVINLVETFVKNLPQGVTVPAVPADAPSAQEVSATFFDYAEKFVANQRACTDRLVAAGTAS